MTRWLRRGIFGIALVAAAFVVTALLRGPVSLPFDLISNLWPAVEAPDLRPPADGKARVVFLQHGLWRTRLSLGRLERTLQANGYEVVNVGYPSTEDVIEGHAARLRDAVERRFAQGKVDELAFVGHSMGGLVIQEYLRRDDAREPKACVYLASPHRGAILADKRQHWLPFQLAMGDQAAKQLVTTDPFHRQPIPHGARSGTVVGDIGSGNRSIPGNDDGTVAVGEATFDGCGDSITVPFGHTRIALMPDVLRQVMTFLRDGRFAHGG